jgi:hypothetical protein
MSIKQKMMNEVNKKAQKIKDDRLAASLNKNIETYALDFIKETEHLATIPDERLRQHMSEIARSTLKAKIRTVDQGRNLRVEVVYQQGTESVQGILIQWSDSYIAANKSSPELYIDVSQLLFG